MNTSENDRQVPVEGQSGDGMPSLHGNAQPPASAGSSPASSGGREGDAGGDVADIEAGLPEAAPVPEPAAPFGVFIDALPTEAELTALAHADPAAGDAPALAMAGVAGAATAAAVAAGSGFAGNGNGGAEADGARSAGGLPAGGRKPIRRPGWGFLLSHPAHWIALGFGSGLPWVVPGTFGTLFGWASFVVCMPHFNDFHWALAIVLGFLVGIWACGVTGRNLGVSDHGSIVWDEIVAIWLVLWLVPRTPLDQAMAFLVFRVIDITKPQPIRHFDAKWKNGFGVMFDDLLAAFFTLLIFAVYYRFAGLPA